MTASAVHPVDLVNPGFHATGDPHAIWRWMREHAPVYRQPATEVPSFWALTRYEDIRDVYRDPETFSSEHGVLLRPSELGSDPGGGLTLALTDRPRHKQIRSLMAAWFNTRSVRALEEYIDTAARRLVMLALERENCEFVQDVAARLSLQVICHVVGAPDDDHEDIFAWSNEAFENHTPLAAHPEFLAYFATLMQKRAVEPGGDLISALANGTIDGEPLTEQEVLLNIENLIGATENGRLALIGGMLAFLEHPEEWQLLDDDRNLFGPAIDEVLRWTSSATHSMRTATRSCHIRGHQIDRGDRVVLWLPSGNRDEAVFQDPFRFNIRRSPNRHVALATGEHFCIGSTLARTEMRILFSHLLDTSVIESTGSATFLESVAVNGPAKLPVRITAK